MADGRAVRGQQEADTGNHGSAKSCELAAMSPSSGEQRKEKRHGQVHDPVGGCADDTSRAAVSLEGPVFGVVFLEYTVAHCKACQGVSRCNSDICMNKLDECTPDGQLENPRADQDEQLGPFWFLHISLIVSLCARWRQRIFFSLGHCDDTVSWKEKRREKHLEGWNIVTAGSRSERDSQRSTLQHLPFLLGHHQFIH